MMSRFNIRILERLKGVRRLTRNVIADVPTKKRIKLDNFVKGAIIE